MTSQEIMALHKRLTRPHLDREQRAVLRFLGNFTYSVIIAVSLIVLIAVACALFAWNNSDSALEPLSILR